MALYLGSPTVYDTIQSDYMKGFRDGAIFIQKHKNDTYRYGMSSTSFPCIVRLW
jgi:hypothetical protein